MRRRVWLTYVVRVDDAEDDDAAREIALEQVRATYASPDGVEIERPDETSSGRRGRYDNDSRDSSSAA